MSDMSDVSPLKTRRTYERAKYVNVVISYAVHRRLLLPVLAVYDSLAVTPTPTDALSANLTHNIPAR